MKTLADYIDRVQREEGAAREPRIVCYHTGRRLADGPDFATRWLHYQPCRVAHVKTPAGFIDYYLNLEGI